MTFSSPLFLFLFLPLFILLNFVIWKRGRNLFLVIISLLFYAWGEPKYILLLLLSILVNYIISSRIDDSQRHKNQTGARLWLSAGLTINLGSLAVFKYTDFLLASSWNWIGSFTGLDFLHLNAPGLPLQLGISFFTFSAVSYLIDIYRQDAQHEHHPIYAALYISFFPKLLAGPIVQYRHMKDKIRSRTISAEKLTSGIQRFITGLGKKVLIANTLGMVADQIFAVFPDQLTAPVSWLGILCYTLQIYFDFSGYSDMAIGIAKMAGFDIPENFNYPYIAQSVREFWQRWHISLSTWFRDYLYIPLGGNRCTPERVYINLMVVFLLCGMWHGAGETFLIWGAWHGIFIALEHAGFGNALKKIPPAFRHLYLILVVMIGWVIFRSDSLDYAVRYIKTMFGFSPGIAPVTALGGYLNSLVIFTLLVGIVASLPVVVKIKDLQDKMPIISGIKNSLHNRIFLLGRSLAELLFLGFILIVSVLFMSGSLNNPFVYFKF
ncbi:MAG: MBOAT family protein [Deltaproteobacteria bacterium]